MPTVVFTGGGTAGHIMPNLALISELDGFKCVYVGTDGMEKDLCAERGIPFYTVPSVKLRRDAPLKNISVPFRLNSCVKSAKRVLEEIKPDLVFSKGGYAALPAVLAAKKLRIPLFCHESDISPGIVTKLAARHAEKVLCAFRPCAERFKNGEYVGTPLRRELFTAMPDGDYAFRSKPRLLVVGGSSGAAAINECVVSALGTLLETFDIIHITGKNKGAAVAAKGYTQIPFCSDMGKAYKSADVALSRAGANALAELIALGVPTVAVPLEKASRGDQIENAEYYKSLGAIKVLKQSDMTASSLAAAVRDAYSDRIELKSAMKKINTNGTQKICGIIRTRLTEKHPVTK